jgi:hypothetical protein
MSPQSSWPKDKPSKKTSSSACSFLIGLFFDPEDCDDMFFRNVCWLSTSYTTLYPRSPGVPTEIRTEHLSNTSVCVCGGGGETSVGWLWWWPRMAFTIQAAASTTPCSWEQHGRYNPAREGPKSTLHCVLEAVQQTSTVCGGLRHLACLTWVSGKRSAGNWPFKDVQGSRCVMSLGSLLQKLNSLLCMKVYGRWTYNSTHS